MKYDPNIHRRRSIRLREYDYSQGGAYFITICVQDMRCIFGDIHNGEMVLNPYGQIACREWELLPDRWPHLELGVFQIMPNHMHGIIVLHGSTGAPARGAPTTGVPETGVPARGAPTAAQWSQRPVIGQIVGAYKSCVYTECLKWVQANESGEVLGKLWQRNFWEHIILDVDAYDRISQYIIENPRNWQSP